MPAITQLFVFIILKLGLLNGILLQMASKGISELSAIEYILFNGGVVGIVVFIWFLTHKSSNKNIEQMQKQFGTATTSQQEQNDKNLAMMEKHQQMVMDTVTTLVKTSNEKYEKQVEAMLKHIETTNNYISVVSQLLTKLDLKADSQK